MKKILFTIILTVTSIGLFAQSKISDLTEDTSIGGNEYLVEAASGSNYKLAVTTILNAAQDSVDITQGALEDSCSDLRSVIASAISAGEYWNYQPGYTPPTSLSYTLYPKNGLRYLGIWLGSAPASGYNKYHLYVDGYTYLADTTWADVMMFGQTQVYDSINQLWFRDPTAGKYSLSGLLGLPTSLSSAWNLSTTTYDWSIYSTSNYGLFWDYSESLMTLKTSTSGSVDIDSPVLTADSIYTDQIGAEKITVDSIVLGGEMIDNWDDVGGGGGGGVGVYVDGSIVGKDSIRVPAITQISPDYDGTDSSDYFTLIYDTLVNNVYEKEVAVSNANITGGATVAALSAPGAGYYYSISRVIVYYDYTGAGITSDDANYSCEVEFATSGTSLLSIEDGAFEAAADNIWDVPVGTVNVSTANSLNNGIQLDFYTHSGAGTGTAKVKIQYTIMEFN